MKGLDIFRQRFSDFEGSLVLIGGAACDDWFTRHGLSFRATKDLDIVLLLEAVDPNFVAAMRQFIDDGGYEIRQRSKDGPPLLYRFAKPTDKSYPFMLEIFSRAPEGMSLAEGQTIIPLPTAVDVHSLSAILVDDAYHTLIRDHSQPQDGISFATATALIPLKAKAWLDLSKPQTLGEKVDAKDINKHRADIFRLAGTLPGEAGPRLAESICQDISSFLQSFPEDAPEWPAILASIKSTLGGNLKPALLRDAIQTYFQLK